MRCQARHEKAQGLPQVLPEPIRRQGCGGAERAGLFEQVRRTRDHLQLGGHGHARGRVTVQFEHLDIQTADDQQGRGA